MINLKRIGLILLTSVLLYVAWPPFNFGPLLFVAFIPFLFYVETLRNKSHLAKYVLTVAGIFASLFLFSYLSSYEAWGEYEESVFIGIFVSFVPLSFIVSLFVLFKRRRLGMLFFVFAWGSMEVLQIKWELNSPLYMLGNGLSMFPSLIQHYAIWGVIGGSMYILAINGILFNHILKMRERSSYRKQLRTLLVLLMPILLSVIVYNLPLEHEQKLDVGIVLLHEEHFTIENANDPYLTIEKYNALINAQVGKADIVVFPESAVINSGWIENVNLDSLTNPLDALCPDKEIILGSHMFSIYRKQGNETPYFVRYDENSRINYQSHNCAIHRNSLGNYRVRSKNKNVPFHEVVPYPSLFMFTKNWFSTSESPTYLSKYDKQSKELFKTKNGIRIHALMCFESFFSDMIVQESEAEVIFILANESWNNQTKGKEQYFYYMIPKAIESGKSIVKVANSGHSGSINSKGQIEEQIGFNNSSATSIQVGVSSQSSIYSNIANELNIFIILVTIVLFPMSLINSIYRRKQY